MSAAIASGVMARIAAIQQMATSLGAGPTTGTGFQTALDAAQTTASAATPAAAGASGPVSAVPYAAEINAAATKYGIDPSLLAGLVKQESGFNPSATSGAGAQGLTQLMPATARSLGVTNPMDPAQSLDGGAKYLKEQLDKFGGDPKLALAAYNAGPGAVQRFGGIPPYAETKAYVERVMSNRDAYAASAGAATAAIAPVSAASLASPAVTDVSNSLSLSSLALSDSSSSGAASASSPLTYPTT